MNTKQLYGALIRNSVTKKKFDGVYAKDTLEDVQSRPYFIIANTAKSTHKGKHWVVFYFNRENNEGEFFDSLGNDLSVYGKEFVEFMGRFSTWYSYSSSRVQPPKSKLCGIYCLFFIYCRCKGLSFRLIIKKMHQVNVCSFVMKQFHLCNVFDSKLIQCCIVR